MSSSGTTSSAAVDHRHLKVQVYVPISSVYCAKLKQQFLEQIQGYENVVFAGPNGPFAPNKNNLEKPLIFIFIYLPNEHTTSIRRRFDVHITSIRGRPNLDEFPRDLYILFRCNFDEQKHTSFSCTFFEVTSVVEKSMLFPHTFFDVISLVEKYTSFPYTF